MAPGLVRAILGGPPLVIPSSLSLSMRVLVWLADDEVSTCVLRESFGFCGPAYLCMARECMIMQDGAWSSSLWRVIDGLADFLCG